VHVSHYAVAHSYPKGWKTGHSNVRFSFVAEVFDSGVLVYYLGRLPKGFFLYLFQCHFIYSRLFPAELKMMYKTM